MFPAAGSNSLLADGDDRLMASRWLCSGSWAGGDSGLCKISLGFALGPITCGLSGFHRGSGEGNLGSGRHCAAHVKIEDKA